MAHAWVRAFSFSLGTVTLLIPIRPWVLGSAHHPLPALRRFEGGRFDDIGRGWERNGLEAHIDGDRLHGSYRDFQSSLTHRNAAMSASRYQSRESVCMRALSANEKHFHGRACVPRHAGKCDSHHLCEALSCVTPVELHLHSPC